MSVKFSVDRAATIADVEPLSEAIRKEIVESGVGDLDIRVDLDDYDYKPSGTVYVSYLDDNKDAATLQASNIRNLDRVTVQLHNKTYNVTFDSYEDATGGRRKRRRGKKTKKSKKNRRYTRRR